MPSRIVHHGEALAWLAEEGILEGASLVTSLPDLSGLPELGLDGWQNWFIDAAKAVLTNTLTRAAAERSRH